MAGFLSRGAPVTVARISFADQDDFIAAAERSRALHAPWVQPALDAATFAAQVRRLSAPDHAGFLFRRRDNGALAGYAALSNIVRGSFQSAYLGYYAFAGHERQGLMKAGLTQVLREAFGPLGLHRVEANIQPGNAASIALAKSLGFEYEGFSPRYLKIGGRWRDHERWAKLAR